VFGYVLEGEYETQLDGQPLKKPKAGDTFYEPAMALPQPGVVLWQRSTVLSMGMLLVYAFASTFQDQLYVFWIPLFLTEGRGLDTSQMGLFTPLPLLGGAFGSILGGMLNDYAIRRTGNRRWSRSGIALTGKMVADAMIAASLQMSDGRVAMLVVLAARCFGDWSLSTQWGPSPTWPAGPAAQCSAWSTWSAPSAASRPAPS
jgi:hypothetical protein